MLRYASWVSLGVVMMAAAVWVSLPVRAAEEPESLPVTEAVPEQTGTAPAEEAATEEVSLELVETDVTAQVRVRVIGSLQTRRDGELAASVSLENISTGDLSGQLVLVVDKTGVEGLTFLGHDGSLENGDGFAEVLPQDKVLKAGAKTASARIAFASAERLSAAGRKGFAPEFRVVRIAVQTPEELAAARNKPLPGKKYSQAQLEMVMRIQERNSERLFTNPGVFGTAVSEDDHGNLVVRVFTQRHGIIKQLPGDVEGVSLDQCVTGTPFSRAPQWTGYKSMERSPFRPPQLPKAATQWPRVGPQADEELPLPIDPTQRFERPVPIGVSIFNLDDLCASGTLGCRVVFEDGRLGILTNSHVGARLSEPAARKEDLVGGVVGDRWTQPGCGDTPTGTDIPEDVIATLVDFQTFELDGYSNIMDAAVARINFPNRGLVLARTPPDGYGFPSRHTISPQLGMKVLKYGRTTGLRRGTIAGINGYVRIRDGGDDYRFTSQITIRSDSLLFSQGGDSGSLIVTEEGLRPVGLLFAGGGFETIANPIQPVLNRFKIAIDDGSETPPNFSNPRTNGRMGGAGGRLPDLLPQEN